MGLQELQGRTVLRIVGVDVSRERPASTISAEMMRPRRKESPRSARRCRLARFVPRRQRQAPRRVDPSPRYASSASRVMSAMVVPRRCASWRSLASSASGICTVVVSCLPACPALTDPLRSPQVSASMGVGSRYGGGRGIRTHDDVAAITVFKTVALGHYASPPRPTGPPPEPTARSCPARRAKLSVTTSVRSAPCLH